MAEKGDESIVKDKSSDDMSEGFHLKKESKKPKRDKPGKKRYKGLVVFIVIVLVGVLLFAGAVFVRNIVNNNTVENTQEEKLSFAEEQATYKLPDNASNEKKNEVAMSNAWAFYDEQNYDRALQILDGIVDPSEEIIADQNTLYGLIYEAQGNEEEAKKYFKVDLEQYEQQLLDDIKTDPTANYTLAELYDKAGEKEKAILHYEAYIAVVKAPRDEMEDYEYQTMIEAQEALERLKS